MSGSQDDDGNSESQDENGNSDSIFLIDGIRDLFRDPRHAAGTHTTFRREIQRDHRSGATRILSGAPAVQSDPGAGRSKRPGDIEFSPFSTTDPIWGEMDPGNLVPPQFTGRFSAPELIAHGIGESIGHQFDKLGSWIHSTIVEPSFSQRFNRTDYSSLPVPDWSDPIWGETDRGHMRPFELGLSLPEQAAEWVDDQFRKLGDSSFSRRINETDYSALPVIDLSDPAWGEIGRGQMQPIESGLSLPEQATERAGDQFEHLGAFTHQSLSSILPGTDYSTSKLSDPAMHMELNDFFMTVEEGKRIQTDNVERLTSSLDEVTPSASHATEATGGLWDSIHELDGGVSTLGGTVDLATLGMHGMQTSMVAGGREALAYAGHLGTAEAQIIRLLAAQARWARRGGRGRSASSHGNIEDDFLSTPAPSNVEELFQQQKTKGHDISGFRDAHHWWEKHLEHVAQLKAAGHAFAQGTSFAPGGMALVGEMGPELVNLPRGSQVIPNPRLGSEVTVNVTVEGSVVAERDLAQRIRQELIRTSRRTVDLGFVA